VVHLGMSGQMLLGTVPRADHVRISALLDDGTVLSFADQRTFGGWLLADLVTVDDSVVPVPVAHLARDPLDPRFDPDAVVKVLRPEVMREALAKGGTSFDSLYVNVNGESGYFDRSLDAYGREGEPCRRCGAVMRREKFMNRSSFYCPRCQPRPR
jgi:formamidopyrimidine-DNA glycosylase